MDSISSLILRVQRDTRTYEFIIPGGAPYGEVYDVAYEVLKQINDMMAQSVKSAAPAKSADASVANS